MWKVERHIKYSSGNSLVVEVRDYSSEDVYSVPYRRYFSLENEDLVDQYHKARRYCQNGKGAVKIGSALKRDLIKRLRDKVLAEMVRGIPELKEV